MAIEATQLMVRVGADTADAQADLRRFAQAVQGVGGVVSQQAQRMTQLTERIGFQQRELALLKDRLDQVALKYGADSVQAQRLQLSIDKLSASIRNNEQALANASQGADRFGQVWIGIQRAVGQEIVRGLTTLAGAVRNLTAEALDSYTGNERLSASLDSLIAKELRNADATLSMSAALAQATPHAQELLKWTQQLAVDSPFGQDGVAKAFQTAQAYGFVSESADKTVVSAKRLTTALIDFSAGAGRTESDMDRIALALGQIEAKGKLSGQEVLQLVNAGIAVDQVLAKAFGKSTSEIVALREQGLIPADQAIRAIVESLEADFGGAAKRQAGTMAGLLNSLQDLKKVGLREFFTGTFQVIQPYLASFVSTLNDPATMATIRGWGQGLGDAFGTVVRVGGEVVRVGGDIVNVIQAAAPAITGVTAGLAAYAAVQTAAAIQAGITSGAIAAQIVALGVQATALYATAAAFVAANAAALALALTIGAVVAAAALAYQKLQEYQSLLDSTATRIEQSSAAWNESTAALDAYTKASDEAKGRAVDQVQALQALRAEQHEAIKAYANHVAAYEQFGFASGQTQASLEREKAAINARGEAIVQATNDLQSNLQATEALHGYDAVENIRAQRDAFHEQAQAVQLSGEELEKLREKLEQIGSQGAQAAERLAQSQADFRAAEEERQAEHAQRIQAITQNSQQQLGEIETQAAEQRAERQQSYQDKLADLARSSAAQEREAAERSADQRAQLQEQHQQRLADLVQRASDRQAEAQQRASDREQQYQDKVLEIQASAAQKAADAEQRELDRREQAQQQYQDKVLEIQASAAQKGADAEQRELDRREQAQQQYQDRVADLAQRAADIQQQAAERAADAQRTYAERLADLQSSAAERARDAEERYNESKSDRAEDHADRLAELQEQLGQAETDAERARIQEQIDDENARYAKQEERARRAYERQRQQAEEALQKQLEQAERARQREEQEAAEQLARQQAHLAAEQAEQERAYAITEERAAEAYERARTERDREQAEQLAKLEQGYAQQEARAKAAYERTRTERDREQAEQLAKLDQQHARERAADDRKLAGDLAALNRQTEAENAELATRLARQTEHDAREAEQRAAKYAAQQADAETAFNRQEQEAARHYAQERQEQERALADKLAAQQAAFASEEQEAAIRHAREQAEQRAHLGQLLIDYVTAEATKNEQVRAHLGELTAAISNSYGVQQSAAAQSFGESLQIIQRFADGSTPRISEVTSGLDRLGSAATNQQAAIDTLANQQIAALTQRFRDGKIDIDEYNAALGRIPADVQTQLNLQVKAEQQFNDLLRAIQSGDLGAIINVSLNSLPGRARGGDVQQGRAYIVGEERPEVFVPNQDGTILPFVPTGGAGGGGLHIEHLIIQAAQDPEATARIVLDRLLRYQQRNVTTGIR